VELREREKEREEKARAEKERTRRRIIQGLAAFSLVALMLFGIAIFEWNQANIKADESLAFYLASQSDQTDASKLSSINQKIALAVESLRHGQTWQGDLALRKGLMLMGIQVAKLPHEGPVNSAEFSPDGSRVVTASDDRTARIWLVSSQELAKIACSRITENITAQEWKLYGMDESTCRTCPREGKFNRSGFWPFWQRQCQPCGGAGG
jgi:hypothetical protein